jgi:hypothetical protein
MTPSGITELAGSVLERPTDRIVRAWVRARGVDAWVDVQPVSDEWSRRRQVGLGALTIRAQLEILSRLPADLPVPWSTLASRDRRWIARLPVGTAHVDTGAVTRLAVSPVKVMTAVVTARNWRRGLHDATQFAPYCARALLIPERPADMGELLLEASFYGVGIGILGTEAVEWVCPPEEFHPTRFTTSSWLFSEQIFQQLLLQQ